MTGTLFCHTCNEEFGTLAKDVVDQADADALICNECDSGHVDCAIRLPDGTVLRPDPGD